MIRARRSPLLFTCLLAALLPLSFLSESPQLTANKSYALLLAGNLSAAVRGFQRALEADAAMPYRWADLATALADQGQKQKARYCFEQASTLSPASAPLTFREANFYFGLGDTKRAVELDAQILRITNAYDSMIFSSLTRFAGSTNQLMDRSLISNPRALDAFLEFLAANADLSRPREAWQWIELHKVADPLATQTYTAWALTHELPAEANAAWASHLATDPGAYAKSDLVDNPGFEREPLPRGFDWQITPVAGVNVTFDRRAFHSGHQSLRLDFTALDNLNFHHVAENIFARPGAYRLSGWIRTQDLSTDEGIALRLVDAKSSSIATATLPLTGTHDWTHVSADLKLTGQPRLLRLELARRPSWKFDNKPHGTVWVDDIHLQPH